MQKKDFREEKGKGKAKKTKAKEKTMEKKGNKSYNWTDYLLNGESRRSLIIKYQFSQNNGISYSTKRISSSLMRKTKCIGKFLY